MQINRLRLRNFRLHEDTELVLGAGLTGIIGPNGAGKTTILEAIAWAMYGMPAARGSRETIRRRGAPPRSKVEVEVDFTLGHHQYRLVRSLQGAELYQDGDPSPVANSLATVTERLTRLLGMTRDEFFNTYFTGQKELAVMAAMSAPERAQFLSRVLGYERLRLAQDRLKERRTGLRAKLETLREGLPDPAELEAAEAQARERLSLTRTREAEAARILAAAERRLGEIRPRWEQLQRLRESALVVDAEYAAAVAQVAGAVGHLERAQRQATEALDAAHQLDDLARQLAPLTELRATAAELERRAESYAARNSLLVQLEDVRAHLASVDERMARLPAPGAVEGESSRAHELRTRLAVVAAELEALRTSWVRDAQDARSKRQSLLDQYQELKDQRQRLVRAGPDGNCPTCARPLTTEYQKVLDLLDRQIEEVVFNGNFYKQRIDQLQVEPADLELLERRRAAAERELSETTGTLGRLAALAQEAGSLGDERARLQARIGELEGAIAGLPTDYDQAGHEAVVARIRLLDPLALQAERLRAIADRRDTLAAELDQARRAGDAAVARKTQLEVRRRELGYDETAYHETREADARLDRERRAAELALVQAQGDRTSAEEAEAAVARRRAERAKREQAAAAVARDLALHQEVDRALTELRTELNTSLRPDLSELASGFLRDLTNGRYTDLELDEQYGTTLLDDGEPMAVVSGGEEDVANLAIRLAISQMIAERAGQPLSLLVLDEIFGSLDEDRRGAVVDLLRSLADRFPQVILITHIESVREGFDRVIRVGLDLARGVATVAEEPVGGRGVAA